jgi:hypothetical protein
MTLNRLGRTRGRRESGLAAHALSNLNALASRRVERQRCWKVDGLGAAPIDKGARSLSIGGFGMRAPQGRDVAPTGRDRQLRGRLMTAVMVGGAQ